ncbi:MAG: IS3 family transposase [Thermoleophilia bacterium]|nr:IS3 family transposase [Thermoleophilia bacterium]
MSAFIDAHRDRFGVEPICREIEVCASAYRARRTRPPSKRARRDEHLLAAIRRVHAASGGVYGQLKVWDELRDQNVIVARCTVERLMRAPHPRRRKRADGAHHPARSFPGGRR